MADLGNGEPVPNE